MNRMQSRILEVLSDHTSLPTYKLGEMVHSEGVAAYEEVISCLNGLHEKGYVRKTFGNANQCWKWQITQTGRDRLVWTDAKGGDA